MSNGSNIRLMWICAAVSLIAGIGLSVDAIGELRSDRARLRTKLAQLDELRRMERQIARYRAAYREFEALQDKRPVPMAGLLKKHVDGRSPEDSRSTRQSSARGWTLRRQEVAFGEVSLDKVMELVHEAESGRPPWRLTRCIVRASSGVAGKGKVDLVFESLDGQ